MKKIQVYRPSSCLTPYIQHFLFPHFSKACINKEGGGILEVLPSPSCSMIIFFSEPSLVKSQNGFEKYDSFALTGYYSSPKTIIRDSSLKQMIIRFTPLGIQQLLDFQLSEIRDSFVHIKQVFKQEHNGLGDEILNCQTHGERVNIFEKFYIKKLSSGPMIDKRVLTLLNYISTHNGSKSIKDITQEFAVGERTIQRLIQRYTGINFKQFSKLIRFREVAQKLRKSNKKLTDVAYEFNYFDQAHFINDFKQFSGMTPLNFMNKHRKNALFDIPNQIY